MGVEVIKKAPALCSKKASAEELRQLFDKDTIFSLPRQQKRLINCLLRAKKPLAVADIIKELGQCDPRGHISRLRQKGYPIGDIWDKSETGERYKRYFIRKEVQDGQ